MKELETQSIKDYELWPGVFVPSIKKSINLAHKQIVEYAQIARLEEVAIAEDDAKWSAPGAWDYFLKQKPKEFDIYLGGIFLGYPDENGLLKEFTGMTCYIIKKSFYDTFLSTPEDEHIDHALKGLGVYKVCDPFVVTQWGGISSNTGKMEEYEGLQASRIFFNG
jgi:hypothetical protein